MPAHVGTVDREGRHQVRQSVGIFPEGDLSAPERAAEQRAGGGAAHGADASRRDDVRHYGRRLRLQGIGQQIFFRRPVPARCAMESIVTLATPYSKNKRVVTVIDTDVDGGTRAGLVAMVEVVALMIGDVWQCYSRSEYRNPQPVSVGMFLDRGCPKSVFRPGSSTTVLLFQENRVVFSEDLIRNLYRTDIVSRYSQGLGRPLAETDTKVRSTIGRRKDKENDHDL